MVKVIQEYLDIVKEEPGYEPSTEDMAEYILGCCETWGMLPPLIEFDFFGKMVKDNAWDDENG